MSLISVTGNVIADEDLGIVTLAADSDPTSPDNNVTLSNFQTGIPASSSLGTSLTSIGLYPSTTTGTGTTQAIGISENAIISATVSNMIFSDSSGNTLNGVDSGFKAIDGNEIFLYSDPTNPDIVLGRESNSAGAVAFALLLQPTSGGATVWVVQYEALTNTNPAVGEDANTLDLANRVYVSGTSTASFNIGTKDPGQNYWLPFTDPTTTTTVLVTGLDASSANPDTVNTSSSGDGSDSQSITPTEGLRFDFVSSYTGGSTKDKTFLTDGTLNSLVYKEGTGATFDISQVTPTGDKVNIQIIAQNETGATFGSTQTNTSANTVALGEIDVYTTGGTLLASSTRTTGNNGITFGGTTSAPNGVVNGLGVDEVVKFFSAGGANFDQFVVENITGTGNTPGFDILNVTQTQTISATTEVGSHILFEDSVPMASANTQVATVDEDALVGEATGETGFGGTAIGNVSNLFTPGVDTPLTYRLITDTSSLPTNVTSHGVAVTYAVTSSGGVDTLTASAGATTVFTLALTESTGAYTFKLFASIDNETPQNGSPEGTFSFDVSKLLQATDADGHFGAGDTATAAANALKLTIIDDQPTVTANSQTATVDEDALVGEATGETGFGGTATGNVSNLFNTGADTPATYSLSGSTSGLPALTSHGVAVTYAITSSGGVDTLTASAGATTVFTLSLTESSGAYSFTLSAAIDNETPQNGSPEGTFSFDVSNLLHVTDDDGSTTAAAANALKLTIIDDQPTVTANTQTATVDEDALVGEATGETGFGGTATGNVSNLFNTGADTPATYSLSGSTSGLPALTSHGVAVTYAITSSGGVDTLTASAGATTVFTLSLTEATGAYSFTLSAAIDNETPQNGSPEGTFSFDVSNLLHVTDDDGSTTAAAANALKLTIIDDQPTVTANTQTATVDEDALVGEATGETGFGGTATGNVSNLFNTGADTPATYSLSGSTSGLPALTSHGVAVTYAITSSGGVDTLTATAGATTVFTLALTEATGAYSFTLSAAIDNESPQNGSPEGTFSFDVSNLLHVTDDDGSTTAAAANALKLTIIDDQPTVTANTQTATVDEDALVGEATGETGFGGTATGNVSNLFTTGADTPATYSLSGSTSGLPALTSHGVAVTYAITSSGGVDTLTASAGATTVFTLALTESTGAYSFTLSAAIDNESPQNGSPEGTFSFDVSNLLHVTDDDGSTTAAAANALKLTIIDDQPTVTANTQTATVDEDALVGEATGETGFGGTATGNVSNLFNTGADTPATYSLSGSTSGLPALTSHGVAVTYAISTNAGVDTLTAMAGATTVFTLALTEATGAYSFTLSAAIDNESPQNGSPEGTFSFDVSNLLHVTDDDGSTTAAATNALKLTIIDDQPTVTANTQTATVDEDALVGEATGETGFGGTATGNVSNLFNTGADTPATYSLSGSTSGLPALTSHGVAVTYAITSSGGVDTLTASAGATTVFTLSLTESSGAYSFTLSAAIDNETPQNGSPEGTFSFDVSNLLHVTDDDGSTTAAAANALKLTIIDDQPTVTANTQTATVDEDALVGEATGETGFGGTAIGNVSNLFNTGADTPATYSLSGSTSGLPALTSHGVAVTYAITSSGGVDTLTASAGATTVFTLALTESSGAYSFTLSAAIDNETPQNGSPEGTFSFDVSNLLHVTDDDGSTTAAAANALKLTIIDDQPTVTANTQTATVDEDALVGEATGETGFGGTATGNVSNLFNTGADTPATYSLSGSTAGLPALTSHGVAVTYAITSSGGVDTLTASAGATTVFTLSLTEASGAYTFKLLAAIDNESPQNGSPEGTFSFDVSNLLHVTDDDGSTTAAAANALKLTIIDDQPTFVANSSTSGSVDEDGLSANLLGDAGSATASGSVASLFKTGADTPPTYTMSTTTSGLPALTSHGVAVTYAVTTAGGIDTLTAKAGATTVFTLALTESTGAWTFTLGAPIDQVPGANDASNNVLNFGSLLQVIDDDGSKATAPANAWSVKIIDDVPANFVPEAIVSGDNVQDVAGSSFIGDLTTDTALSGSGEPADPYPLLNIQQHAGGDGFGALTFTGQNGSLLMGQIGSGASQDLQANGHNIYLFGFGTGLLTATTDAAGQGLPGGASGTAITADEVFTITTNPASDQYTFNMLQPIVNGAQLIFNDFADVPAGNYSWFALPFTPAPNNIPPGPVQNTHSVVFTGLSAGTDTVNPSSIGVGTDKQAVAPGKAIRLDFVDNVGSISAKTAMANLTGLHFKDHYDVTEAGFTISQINPTGKTVDIRLDAYNVPTAATTLQTTDTNQQKINDIKIVTEDSKGNITATLADFTSNGTKTITVGGVTETVTVGFGPSGDANGVDLTGLKQLPGVFILAGSANGFDRLLATNIGTVYNNKDTFDMGAVSAPIITTGSNVNMAFNLALQDYDASNSGLNSNLTEAGTGTLNVTLTPKPIV